MEVESGMAPDQIYPSRHLPSNEGGPVSTCLLHDLREDLLMEGDRASQDPAQGHNDNSDTNQTGR